MSPTLAEIINLNVDDADVDYLVAMIGRTFGWNDLSRNSTFTDERHVIAVEVYLEKWAK